jgi:hypothetical protein
MKSLSQVLAVLEYLLEEGNTNGTWPYQPDISDKSDGADLKRRLIGKAHDVQLLGEQKLLGRATGRAGAFNGNESNEIETILADDPGSQKFQELVDHASIAQKLINDEGGAAA